MRRNEKRWGTPPQAISKAQGARHESPIVGRRKEGRKAVQRTSVQLLPYLSGCCLCGVCSGLLESSIDYKAPHGPTETAPRRLE